MSFDATVQHDDGDDGNDDEGGNLPSIMIKFLRHIIT